MKTKHDNTAVIWEQDFRLCSRPPRGEAIKLKHSICKAAVNISAHTRTHISAWPHWSPATEVVPQALEPQWIQFQVLCKSQIHGCIPRRSILPPSHPNISHTSTRMVEISAVGAGQSIEILTARNVNDWISSLKTPYLTKVSTSFLRIPDYYRKTTDGFIWFWICKGQRKCMI